jgi:membrane-associated phospholipid phosphatase
LLYTLADLIARHALLVLTATVMATLTLAAALWRIVNKVGPRSWSATVALWNAARQTPLARRVRGVPVLGALLARTLTVARYLGVVAVLGFLAAGAAIVMFVELSDEIGLDESLAKFDIALSEALREHVSVEILRAFAIITHLGDVPVLIGVGAVVWVLLLLRGQRLLAAAWVVATVSGGLLTRILKALFERSRPLHDHGLAAETGWSFPSGHASGSMLVYGLLAYLVVRQTPPAWHVPAALVGMALVIFVGSSRVLLQVHYFSDVLAGYASAAAWVAIWIAALEAVRWRGARSASAGR